MSENREQTYCERLKEEHREMQTVIAALLTEFDHPPRAVIALPIIERAYAILEKVKS